MKRKIGLLGILVGLFLLCSVNSYAGSEYTGGKATTTKVGTKRGLDVNVIKAEGSGSEVTIVDVDYTTQTKDLKITLDGEEITETNSGDIKTAVETIDNFISGSKGLVTEDNSADIKTATEAVNTAVQSGGITQTQLDNIKTAVETIDNAMSGNEIQADVLTLPNIGIASPTLYNITITNADTEYSQALTDVKSIMFQCRGNYDVRYAFVTGKVATPTAPYMTLKAGAAYSEEFLNVSSMTLYVACVTDDEVVELEVR